MEPLLEGLIIYMYIKANWVEQKRTFTMTAQALFKCAAHPPNGCGKNLLDNFFPRNEASWWETVTCTVSYAGLLSVSAVGTQLKKKMRKWLIVDR